MNDLPGSFRDGSLQETPLYMALMARVLEYLPPDDGSLNLGPPPSDQPARGVRLATDYMDIMALLQQAARSGEELALTYRDSADRLTDRRVTVSGIEKRRVGLGFQEDYLRAFDTEKQEPRTFKVDRIVELREV
jgi:hypothetical protein